MGSKFFNHIDSILLDKLSNLLFLHSILSKCIFYWHEVSIGWLHYKVGVYHYFSWSKFSSLLDICIMSLCAWGSIKRAFITRGWDIYQEDICHPHISDICHTQIWTFITISISQNFQVLYLYDVFMGLEQPKVWPYCGKSGRGEKLTWWDIFIGFSKS